MNPSFERLETIKAHRAHYETLKLAAGVPKARPPATCADDAPLPENSILEREAIPGGWYWTARLARGTALRLVNVQGRATASFLAWNAAEPSERLNHADTIKVQWTSVLRKGCLLLSDMGRVMCSIVEDTSGAHDALVGGSTPSSTLARFGTGHRNTRENFILAAGKLGLTRNDVASCIAFFAPVSVMDDGRFFFDGAKRKAGDFIDLRAEMDLLVAVSNCPHPLDPADTFHPGPLEAICYLVETEREDCCRSATAEAVRAFENNERQRVL